MGHRVLAIFILTDVDKLSPWNKVLVYINTTNHWEHMFPTPRWHSVLSEPSDPCQPNKYRYRLSIVLSCIYFIMNKVVNIFCFLKNLEHNFKNRILEHYYLLRKLGLFYKLEKFSPSFHLFLDFSYSTVLNKRCWMFVK